MRTIKTTETETQQEVMKYKINPLTKDWLCWIPNTPQAYYCETEKKAKNFCAEINNAFKVGKIKFNESKSNIIVNS